MNTRMILLLVAVVGLGIIGVLLANLFASPDAGGTDIRTTEQVIDNPRTAPEARENSFNIMTPEEKAAADAAAELAALAVLASSTASTTASSSLEVEAAEE